MYMRHVFELLIVHHDIYNMTPRYDNDTVLLHGASALVIPEDAGVCVCVGRRSRENQLIACEISNVIGAARTRGATLCGLCAGCAACSFGKLTKRSETL